MPSWARSRARACWDIALFARVFDALSTYYLQTIFLKHEIKPAIPDFFQVIAADINRTPDRNQIKQRVDCPEDSP
jgi:hypothetical protein